MAKNEYDEFTRMAFELCFSIEDELKIYARLLERLIKNSSTTEYINDSDYSTGQKFNANSSFINKPNR